MSKKDYFSGHSKLYATFRPTYPDALYQFILKQLPSRSAAWDCATGNGQVAQVLSGHFDQVFATDISQQQIDNAFQAKNIQYTVQPAEKTTFADHQFDLITVAQAMHWFDIEKFYEEAKRVGKKNGLLAVWGYAVCTVNPKVDEHFYHYYNHVVGPYWDSARKMVEEEYKNIPFPFEQIQSPKFSIRVEWTLAEFTGYLSTWSATQKYMKANNHDPVPQVANQLAQHWSDKRIVTFPIFLKLGRII